jgi:hypothetical protein
VNRPNFLASLNSMRTIHVMIVFVGFLQELVKHMTLANNMKNSPALKWVEDQD